MKIGLYGIEGLYNFGCEAIIRGTSTLIWKVNPNAEIYYFSPRYYEDSVILADISVKVVPIHRRRNYIYRGINKIHKVCRFNKRLLLENIIPLINDMDVVFSIGGDIYTIPEYCRENIGYDIYNKLVRFGEIVLSYKKYIIWGASIGPFGSRKVAIDYYVKHLKIVDYIFARESKTINYLNHFGINNNISLIADPAFFVSSVDSKIDFNSHSEIIGLNLSPLSMYEMSGENADKMMKTLSLLIKEIIKKTGMEILLIPHVISPDSENDNDLLFLTKLKNSCLEFDDKIRLLNDCRGFLNVKFELRKCRFVIAARMHCAINAVREGIPTIFLAYSSKAEGMSEFVYGNNRWTVRIDQIDSILLKKVCEMSISCEEVKTYLNKRVQEIIEVENYDTAYFKFKEILE